MSFTLFRCLSFRLVVLLLAGTIGLGVAPARAARDGDAIFLPSRITTDFDGADDRVAAIAVQPDGRLLAAGYARVDGVSRIALARYLPGGVLDPTFSGDGRAISLIGAWSAANAVALQDDGKIVVAGTAADTSDGAGQFALVRFLADGRPDPTFGTAGAVMTDFNDQPSTEIIHALAIQPDGKLVVAGFTMTGMVGDSRWAVARYLPDGRLDPTFDHDGKQIEDFGPSTDTAHAVVLQPDGKIVVAGRGSWCGPALVRYLPDGQPDPTFAAGPPERRTEGMCGAGSVALDRDGNIVIAGGTGAYVPELAVARYRPDGTPDPTFGRNGEVATRIGRQAGASAVTIQSNGKVIAAGVADVGTDRFTYAFAITRYRPDGSLDPTFDGDGIAITDFSAYTDEAAAVTVMPTGQIVAAGQAAFTAPNGGDFAIAGLAPPLVDLPPVIGPGATGTRPGATPTTVLSQPTSSQTTSKSSTTVQNPTAPRARPSKASGLAPLQEFSTRGPGSDGVGATPSSPLSPTVDKQAPSMVAEASLPYAPAGNRRGSPPSRSAAASIAALAAAAVAMALAATRFGCLGTRHSEPTDVLILGTRRQSGVFGRGRRSPRPRRRATADRCR